MLWNLPPNSKQKNQFVIQCPIPAIKNPGPQMNNKATLYWYDYEAFGLNPMTDRLAQFAGVRTDMEMNIIGEPLMMYCKPADDFLPNPT